MKKIIFNILVIAFFAIIANSCGTTGSGYLYTESTIPPEKVKYQTVAILPNRLPLNLQNLEKWRTSNWKLVEKRFSELGYKVIDYNTSVQMFKKSGLPLEDSKISRDKMAELATELNADLLILPYYGTSYDLGGFLDKNSFNSVGSFQVYSAKHNDFVARVDFDGTNYYCAFTKVGLIGSTTLTLVGSLAGSGAVAIVGAVIGIVPSLWAAINSFQNKDKRYNKAFIKGINKGMDVYFAKFPKQSVVETPVKKTNIEDNNNVTQPKTNYEKFSLQELEDMKKKAVSEKDYSKAAEIKEEINKRNQK
jgi:hypothetical protein